jgi:hypothetical protein
MKPLRASGLIVVIVAAFSFVTTAAAPPDIEHSRLLAMCGRWNAEITFRFQPNGPAVLVKGASTIEPLFNGTFIEERIQGELDGMPFTTLAWAGFNTATRQYEATRIASTNTFRIAETGAYDEGTGELALKADYPFAGDTWHQRTVIRVLSPDFMLATSYLSFGTVPEWKGVEIKYSRSGK